MPDWLSRLQQPQQIFQLFGRLIPPLGVIAFLTLACGLIWGLLFSPVHHLQGDSFRIIFVHLPAARLSQSIYIAMTAAAVLSLLWRLRVGDIFIAAAAPLGAAITFLALFTGALWGKPTWGAWWVWDARLTSVLLLFFIYLAILALRHSIEDRNVAARATAILTVVGSINIPIIKYSVEWWNTMHQPAAISLTDRPPMPSSMWIPLFIMIAGYYLLVGWIALMRMRNEMLIRYRRSNWVREYVLARY